MRLAGFDLETTGFSGATDHIVQFSFQVWDSDICMVNETHLVNPGIPIPNSEIHGVTDDMVKSAISESAALVVIDSLIRATYGYQIPIIAMNAAFDFTFYYESMRRFQVLPASHFYVVDPMVIDKRFDKWRPGKRKLENLCETYGITEDYDFHDAGMDVKASIDVAKAMLQKFGLPRWGFEALHKSQVKWYDEQQRSLYEYFRKSGDSAADTVRLGWPVSNGLVRDALS